MGLFSKLFKKASGFSEFEKQYYQLPLWGVLKSQREWRGLDSVLLEPMDALPLIPVTAKPEDMPPFNHAYDCWESRGKLALQLELNFKFRDQVFQIARYKGTENGHELSLYTYMYAGKLIAVWQKRYDFGRSFTNLVNDLGLDQQLASFKSKENLLMPDNGKAVLWLQVMGNTQLMHILNLPLMEQVANFVKENRFKSLEEKK